MLSLASLRRGSWRDMGWPIAIGALIADLPMFGFYLYQRVYVGAPEIALWTDLYFRPRWQLFFDLFNSIPIVVLFLVAAIAKKWTAGAAVAASWLLHLAFDLPLHNDDAHRHFLPLSAFRYESPISYWDPAHMGAYAAAAEVLLVAACSYVLARETRRTLVRVVLATWVFLSVAGWTAFYVFGRIP